MKRLLLALILAAPAIALFGCQDASLKGDVAMLQQQVAALRDDNEQLRNSMTQRGPDGTTGNSDVNAMAVRLERAELELKNAKAKLAELEARPAAVVAAPGEGGEASATKEVMKAQVDEILRERDEARRLEREKRQQEQMARAAELAKENGIDFDPADPRGSIQRIMANPEQRAKAMQVMQQEMTKRRLEPLGLDERQTQEVLRIEGDTRNKIRETMNNARASGASQEEIAQQVDNIRKDQEDQLKRTMTPEQYEQYQQSGAGMGGMIPGNWQDMIPPGMIPGGGGGWGGGGR
ncbi:MAG: hypothetical protein KF696_15475 [Planctomycetes bacterium]|nr:hypothetical protein [Planctomycetota bacterium]MCW8136626.1 hypothetical protein [Planctomycetota bacterium]